MRMGKGCIVCVIIAFLLSSGAAVTGQTVTNVWTGGGENNNWFDGNNWSQSTYPAGGQAVIIDSTYATAYTNILLTNSTPWLDSFVISNRMLTFSNWTTTLNATNVTVYNNGVLTLPAAFTSNQMSNQIYIACANFVLHEGGSINADASGYAGGYNITNGWAP